MKITNFPCRIHRLVLRGGRSKSKTGTNAKEHSVNQTNGFLDQLHEITSRVFDPRFLRLTKTRYDNIRCMDFAQQRFPGLVLVGILKRITRTQGEKMKPLEL